MIDEITFPNRVQNQLRELEKLASKFDGNADYEKLEARVKRLEGELMAMKARMGKHSV